MIDKKFVTSLLSMLKGQIQCLDMLKRHLIMVIILKKDF